VLVPWFLIFLCFSNDQNSFQKRFEQGKEVILSGREVMPVMQVLQVLQVAITDAAYRTPRTAHRVPHAAYRTPHAAHRVPYHIANFPNLARRTTMTKIVC